MNAALALFGAVPFDLKYEAVYYIQQLVERAHGQLDVIATSKLAWIPRFSVSLYGEINLDDPQTRLDELAKVVRLGSLTGISKGRISPLANAIHPLNSFKKSTFTTIHIEGLPSKGAGRTDDPDSPHAPNLTLAMNATVFLSFLVLVAGIYTSLSAEDYHAVFALVMVGCTQSIFNYVATWMPTRIRATPPELGFLDINQNTTKADIMIYTARGALIRVICSAKVAEELYFDFTSYTQSPLASNLAIILISRLVLIADVLIMMSCFGEAYKFTRFLKYSESGYVIMRNTFIATLFIETCLGLLPSDWRWDLSRYYWADMSPGKSLKSKKKSGSKLSKDPKSGSKKSQRTSSVSSFDWKFTGMMTVGVLASKNFLWIDQLQIIEQSGKAHEVRASLILAAALMDPAEKAQALRQISEKKGIDITVDPLDPSSPIFMKLYTMVLQDVMRKTFSQLMPPSPSRELSFHVNSRTRELGLSSWYGDVFKAIVELCAGRRLSWYPLQDPEDLLRTNHVRVYSVDSIGSTPKFYYDIPKSVAQKLFSFPFSTKVPTRFNEWWLPDSPRVFLRDKSLLQVVLEHYKSKTSGRETGAASSTAAAPETEGSNDEGEQQQAESMDTSTEDLKTPPDEVDEDEKDTKIAAEVETHPPQSQEDEETTLFVCADVASHDSRAQSAKVGTNDRETIERLRKAYRNISSKWPGVKRITGIRFFRFHSFLQRQAGEDKHLLVHIHKDKQRYPVESDPEYPEYRYAPRPWPVGLPFPAREICWYFLHPEDCGTSSALNDMLPARVASDLKTHRRAFGIYVQEQYSVWAIFLPVVGLTCIMLVATLWFIKDHKDDLQTAIVPFTVASSIGTLVVNVAVSLLLFRMLAP